MTSYRVITMGSSVPGRASQDVIGYYTSERAARAALRAAIGVSRCDDSFLPCCAGDGAITGACADKYDDDSPFGWVEVV